MVATIDQCIEETVGKQVYTEVVSSLVFWLMYDFTYQTKETEIMLKNMEEKWPKSMIAVFKERAIRSIPSEFMRNHNIPSVLCY